MLNSFPVANGLPPAMTNLIVHLAELWAQDPERPRITEQVGRHWDSLIAAWVADRSLPLFVRKANNNRGSVETSTSGRSLVLTDNSPAQWAFALAVMGQMPSLEEIRAAMINDQIPVAMILKSRERSTARYKCTLNKVVNPNSAGWKVAHIEGVGLRSRTALAQVSQPIVEAHFRRLMAPTNMFLVPQSYAGLAELPEFCQALRALVTTY